MYGKIFALAMDIPARFRVPREYIPPDFGYEPSSFEKIINTVMTVGCFIFMGAFLIYIATLTFCKGREKRIFIVRKRVNTYKVYSKYGSGFEEHCVVYAKYPNSDKIHTLNCDYEIFQKLREGKSYTVTVKIMRIVKLHREKLRSKKKR